MMNEKLWGSGRKCASLRVVFPFGLGGMRMGVGEGMRAMR